MILLQASLFFFSIKKNRTLLPEIIYGLQLARSDILASNEIIPKEEQPRTTRLVEISEEDASLANMKLFEDDIDLADIIGLPTFSVSSSMSTLVSDDSDSHSGVANAYNQEDLEKEIHRKLINLELRSLQLRRQQKKMTVTVE